MGGDGGNVELTSDQLRKVAKDTYAVADRIDRILGELASARPGGAPWGDDSYGRQFADDQGGNPGYVNAGRNIDTGGANIVKTIRSYADGIVAAAAKMDAGEHGSSQQFAGLNLGSNGSLADQPGVPEAHPGWTVRLAPEDGSPDTVK